MPSRNPSRALKLPFESAAEPLRSRISIGRVHGFERWALRKLLAWLGSPPISFVLWNGEEIASSEEAPEAKIRIHDRATLLRLFADPEVSFGDGYSAGTITVEGGLVPLLELLYRSKPADGRLIAAAERWRLRLSRLNTLGGSRGCIHHHYDLGNDFYRLWLDDRLVYTCAYFPSPEASLEEAQVAKMEHVCRKLALRPGETVIEAGCGWGSLALHMARRFGVKVRAFNISREQVELAREWAKQQDLTERVEFVEDDYRNISGTCDAFVSVGMLEHVGRRYYRDLGRVIDRCLGTNGRGLIHSIGRNRPRPMSRWIERRIFPGAYPPTLGEMSDIFEPFDFSVLDVENLRLHYARTLQHWLERYEASADRVGEMFDAAFVRAWRLYLAGAMVAFRASTLQLFQVVFARGRSNEIPWTRAHVYAAS
jgi:cyclopropane-fatty-acyl-phospholipid synthase